MLREIERMTPVKKVLDESRVSLEHFNGRHLFDVLEFHALSFEYLREKFLVVPFPIVKRRALYSDFLAGG